MVVVIIAHFFFCSCPLILTGVVSPHLLLEPAAAVGARLGSTAGRKEVEEACF